MRLTGSGRTASEGSRDFGQREAVKPEEEGRAPREIGVITAVAAPAGQELWTITTPAGEEVLLPAVPEFVLDIDLTAEIVVIAPPPGLLDLYLGKH